MSWQESVERVLVMRRAAGAEADRAELIRIIQELEKRCQVVVNREASAVLKDVPSWKTQAGAPEVHKIPRFRGGIRTWAEIRRQKEKAARAGTDKLKRRTKEFEQVLSGKFGTEDLMWSDSDRKGAAEVHEQIQEEKSDVESAST